MRRATATEADAEASPRSLEPGSRISFVCHGARIDIVADERVSTPTLLLDRLRSVLPPSAVEHRLVESPDLVFSISEQVVTPGSRRFSLRIGESLRLDRGDEETLLRVLESEVHTGVAENARGDIFVHAGVVAFNDRLIVIPGRSGSGKTTLVSALLRQGASYCSDEYAVVDQRGWVYPYRKNLSVRVPGADSVQVAPESFGQVSDDEARQVALIVVARYAEGSVWQPQVLSAGEAVLALLDNTILVQAKPGLSLKRMSRMCSHVRALEGVRGEADELAPFLLEECDRSAREPST